MPTAIINAKVDQAEKDSFVATAEALGLSASSALRVFVKKFNEHGGFPFDVRQEPSVWAPPELTFSSFDDPRLIQKLIDSVDKTDEKDFETLEQFEEKLRAKGMLA